MKKSAKTSPSPKDAVKTVTCRHCRYERPAADLHCPICGYPWPWLKNGESETVPKGK